MKILPFKRQSKALAEVSLLNDAGGLTPLQAAELRYLMSRVSYARNIFQEVNERIEALRDEILKGAY